MPKMFFDSPERAKLLNSETAVELKEATAQFVRNEWRDFNSTSRDKFVEWQALMKDQLFQPAPKTETSQTSLSGLRNNFESAVNAFAAANEIKKVSKRWLRVDPNLVNANAKVLAESIVADVFLKSWTDNNQKSQELH